MENKKMKKAEIDALAKAQAMELIGISDLLNSEDVELLQVGKNSFVTPFEIAGKEVWVEINLVAKNHTQTEKTDAYDGRFEHEDFVEQLALKEEETKRKAEEKAKKEESRKNRKSKDKQAVQELAELERTETEV